MRDIEIRPTIPSDLDPLADVLVEVHATDGYPVEGVSDPRAWVQLTRCIGQWTAVIHGVPVGHVALVPVDSGCPGSAGDTRPPVENMQPSVQRTAEITRLFVSPAFRGKGLASRLMDVAEKAARSMGLQVVLDVMEKDKGAQALYESRGWTIIRRTRYQYGDGLEEPALLLALIDGPNVTQQSRGAEYRPGWKGA